MITPGRDGTVFKLFLNWDICGNTELRIGDMGDLGRLQIRRVTNICSSTSLYGSTTMNTSMNPLKFHILIQIYYVRVE
jgi:hypothetical protein